MTSLASGFALAAGAVSAETITTGLEAGEFKIHPDAARGFNADYRPSYNADAAKDAWAMMLAWFKKYGVA